MEVAETPQDEEEEDWYTDVEYMVVDWFFDEFDTYRSSLGMGHGKIPNDRVRQFFRQEIGISDDWIETLVDAVRNCDEIFLQFVGEVNRNRKAREANKAKK